MFVQLDVEVHIRKGLGPDMVPKFFPVAFDDIEEGTSRAEIEEMAKMEVEGYLRNTEDYPHYGKNWTIVGYHYT